MRISLFNPFSKEYTALKDFPKLTGSQKIITIALTILATIATLFVFGVGGVATFRSLVGRFKIEPKKETDPLVKNKLECPVFDSKKGWGLYDRGNFFKYHYHRILSEKNKMIASSIDNGECFYDSAAQTLSFLLKKPISIKDVHLKISEYVEKLDRYSQDKNWIKKALSIDDIGETYDSFREKIGLTMKECGSKTPVWGNAITAKILAEVYNVRLIIHSLGTYDSNIESIKDVEKDQIFQVFSDQDVAEVLFEEEDQIFGKMWDPVIEMASYGARANGHFYPVFDK